MTGLVSATSSSLFHGIILLLIMLTSLAAFVASKLSDPCEDFYLTDNLECSTLTSISFSVINILSCLYSFTIYFLHLIGQCDWSTRRRIIVEILCTLGMIGALSGSIVTLLTKTLALKNVISLTASIFSIATIVLYLLRTGLLLKGILMIWLKPFSINLKAARLSKKTPTPTGHHNEPISPSGHQQKSTNSVKSQPRVGPRGNDQTVNPIANDNETELEDDVFIT